GKRWTAGFLAIVVLAFASGIAAVGVVHQCVWLATSPRQLVQDGDARFFRGYSGLALLRPIAEAEERFKEKDLGTEGHRYGTLDELVRAGLVGEGLGSGGERLLRIE